MGFLDPNKLQEDDELVGGSGLHLDLDTKVCPSCRREAMPWQTECEDCGVPTVVVSDLPVPRFELPDLRSDDEEIPETGDSEVPATDDRTEGKRDDADGTGT